MIFEEQDIKFELLASQEFEELCFDMLLQLGFHSLTWRQGGADSGRDIEGYYTVTNPLTRNYDEKWFFECKRYSEGIPPNELSEKFSWADAERPKHLVILVSSYISNNGRVWLEKQSSQSKYYKIHLIEGKQLKQILLSFPEIVNKYFVDKYFKALEGFKRNWVVFGIIPDSRSLYFIYHNIQNKEISIGYLVFIWFVWIFEQLDPMSAKHSYREYGEEYRYENLFERIKSVSTTGISVLNNYDSITANWFHAFEKVSMKSNNELCMIAKITVSKNGLIFPAFYCFSGDDDNVGLEFLLEGRMDLNTKIRPILENAIIENRDARNILFRDNDTIAKV